jgi:lipopolysaccharide biosynthesis regulator YciM
MQKHDKDPNSEEMQKAARENKKSVFAAKMIGLTAIESEETEEELKSYTDDYILINY